MVRDRLLAAKRLTANAAIGMLLAVSPACSSNGSQSAPDAGGTDAVDTTPAFDAGAETDGPGPDTGAPDVADGELLALDAFVDAVCSAQAQWWCAHRTECACPDADDAGCNAAAYARCSQRIGEQVGANPEGWLAYADEAERCVAAFADSPVDCGLIGNERLDASCAASISLAASIGSACLSEGASCAAGAGVCSGGTCAALQGAGAACRNEGSTRTCLPGLACIGDVCAAVPVPAGMPCDEDGHCEARARCVAGACVAGSIPGEPCGSSRPCVGAASCVDDVCVLAEPTACTEAGETGPCGAEGICGAERTQACALPAAIDEPCTETAQCAEGAWCDVVVGRCVAAPGEGAACGEGVWCAAGLACGFDSGLCAPIPQDGETCALGLFGPFVCADGLACVGGRCGPIPGEGQECGGGAVCGDGLGCSFEGDISRCRARRGAGEPCDNDTICTEGTHCDFSRGVCRAHFDTGAACSQGNECGPGGSCVPGEGGRFACVPLPAEGEACLFDCDDGLRCRSTAGPLACFAAVCAVGG